MGIACKLIQFPTFDFFAPPPPLYRYDIGDGKLFYWQYIQILPAESQYSASRIWIFCQQNLDILPAELNQPRTAPLGPKSLYSMSWAWHSSAPSCFFLFLKRSLSHLRSARLLRAQFLCYLSSAGRISRFCQNIIVPAECEYFAGKISIYCRQNWVATLKVQADLYIWRYITWDSTIFCRQNIHTLLAELSYNTQKRRCI